LQFALRLGAIPEPATWAMMILGFGMIGGAMRRRRAVRPTVRVAYS
jgi:PEP-CTERM motif